MAKSADAQAFLLLGQRPSTALKTEKRPEINRDRTLYVRGSAALWKRQARSKQSSNSTRYNKDKPSYTSLRLDPLRASVSCEIPIDTEDFMPLHSNLAHGHPFFLCSICNEFLELETAKTDDGGQPVHEECYVKKVILKRSIRPPPLSQAIVTFLESSEAHTIQEFCPRCGSKLEHQTLTFFYAGQTFNIPIPICLDCERTNSDFRYDS